MGTPTFSTIVRWEHSEEAIIQSLRKGGHGHERAGDKDGMGWLGGFTGYHARNAAAVLSPRIPTESTQQDEVSSSSTRFSTRRKQKGKVKNANSLHQIQKRHKEATNLPCKCLQGSSQPS